MLKTQLLSEKSCDVVVTVLIRYDEHLFVILLLNKGFFTCDPCEKAVNNPNPWQLSDVFKKVIKFSTQR